MIGVRHEELSIFECQLLIGSTPAVSPRRNTASFRSGNHRMAMTPRSLPHLHGSTSPCRPASVLVLVMTLLGILFVVGVAFLATMNFEADMISAVKQRSQSDGGVDAAAESAGAGLWNALIASPGVPFGDSSLALTATAFAEMPGVQNTFSPIEPVPTLDGRLVFLSSFDAAAQTRSNFLGPTMPPSFAVYSAITGAFAVPDAPWVNGQTITQTVTPPIVPLGLCTNGVYQCDTNSNCVRDPQNPGDCIYPRVADADGDGIVDSLLVDGRTIGLSDAQLAELAARVNPASNLSGKISVALRVVPHGGMVNLNESHPALIQNVFDLQSWPAFGDPPDVAGNGGFVHGPTQARGPYSAVMEESLLRRRGNIPPREFQPSLLHGNPFPNSTVRPDMAWMLFWPDWTNGGAAAAKFESASAKHRFTVFSASEMVSGVPNTPYWTAMMEPTASLDSAAIPWNATGGPGVAGSAYDRRHLVTTISHDDLLARSGTLTTAQGKKDFRQAMLEANWTTYYADDCVTPLPFEYANYPPTAEDLRGRRDHDMQNYCCPHDPKCLPSELKGRLQLSLPWIDEQLNILATDTSYANFQLQSEFRDRIYHTIHDAFLMLVQNTIGLKWEDRADCNGSADCQSGEYCRRGPTATAPGKCSSAAPYWDDVLCLSNADCKPGDFVCDTAMSRCKDPTTHQRRHEALVTRAAASLTANIIDYVDSDDVPTRIAIRHFSSGLNCNGGANHNVPCVDDTGCSGGTCANLSGRDIDLDPVTNGLQGIYVYGLERQPFITEVITLAEPPGGPDPVLTGWSIELFNPYPFTIELNAGTSDQYILRVVKATNPPEDFLLDGSIPSSGSGQPLKVFYNGNDPSISGGPAPKQLNNLKFENGDILYLVHSIQYPNEPTATEIVVDQFAINGANIGQEGASLNIPPPPLGAPPPPLRYSMERVVRQDSIWTAVVPDQSEMPQNVASPGTWNTDRIAPEIHPVLVDFVGYSGSDGKYATAFPTTGSMLTLLREANRGFMDYGPSVKDLAFNTWLNTKLEYSIATGATNELVTIESRKQIDNGRMPIFDIGAPSSAVPPQNQHAHHVAALFAAVWDPANPSSTAHPGNLNTLPWGQLLFDYFTALPLNNGGPYDIDSAGNYLSIRDMPKVDQGGLRVHGRININAAPWKVLAGLLTVLLDVPAGAQPTVSFAGLPQSIRTKLTPVATGGPIGPELAQAIVAYRDARSINDPATGTSQTGNYDDGTPLVGTPPNTQSFGRGWTNATPAVRRGTGFMSVGELANVRHPGAAVAGGLPPGSPYRVDSDTIDLVDNNNNNQDFIDAAAVLIALGDWVSVRSHVFTVYGQIRGADDPAVAALHPPNSPQQLQAVTLDTDARAIRFQETVDRLPVLQGQPRPQRIGQRTVGKYTDVNND